MTITPELIREECEFSSALFKALPNDSEVLFFVTGRLPHRILHLLERATDKSDELGVYERNTLTALCPNNGQEKLQNIFSGRKQQFSGFIDVAAEMFGNASRYGMDAFLTLSADHSLSIVKDVMPVYDLSASQIPISHASIAILSSQSAGQLYFLTQNFATEQAGHALTKKYEEINALLVGDALSHIDHNGHVRPANPYHQPLLGMGGPIGSALKPFGTLNETFIHKTGGIGANFIVGTTQNPVKVKTEKAKLMHLYAPMHDETRAALDFAIATVQLKPEEIRSVTVAATFSLDALVPS